MKITPDEPVTAEQTAAHEAGHATVALGLNITVLRLAMPEDGNYSGICDLDPTGVLAQVDRKLEGVNITKDMLITAAGPVAGFLHRVRSWPAATPDNAGMSQQVNQIFQADSDGDLSRLRALLEPVGAKHLACVIWSICSLCKQLLEKQEQLHSRLAAKLLRCASLDAQQIASIVDVCQ